MSMRLDGKIAVVTKGLSGIGAAIAKRMAGEGATVIAADRSTEILTLGSGPLLPLHVDVQDPSSAVFLCSGDASFITGHVLVVDGGFSATGLAAVSSNDGVPLP
jgi:NAD(P)-dependent dehydrogenase (short-subunit alcohol dehydrogenase family)